VATWLNQVCPVVTPRLLADGAFTFANVAVDVGAAAPAESYQLQWFHFDNATGTRASAGDARIVSALASRAPADLLGSGEFVGVAVTARHPQHRGWARPATFFFRRSGQEWSLVGVERG
jgi:hypothetical protein